MKNKKIIITGIVELLLAALLLYGLLTFAGPCEAKSGKVRECYTVFRALEGTAGLLCAVTLLRNVIPGAGIKKGLSIAVFPICALSFVYPYYLFSLCTRDHATCKTSMMPFVIVVLSCLMLAALADIILNRQNRYDLLYDEEYDYSGEEDYDGEDAEGDGEDGEASDGESDEATPDEGADEEAPEEDGETDTPDGEAEEGAAMAQETEKPVRRSIDRLLSRLKKKTAEPAAEEGPEEEETAEAAEAPAENETEAAEETSEETDGENTAAEPDTAKEEGAETPSQPAPDEEPKAEADKT